MVSEGRQFRLHNTIPFDLDGIPKNERIAVYTNDDQQVSVAQFQVYDLLRRQWVPRFEMEGEGPDGFSVLLGHWWTLNKWVLILSHRSPGAGWPLNYVVLGYHGPELRRYLLQENLYLGDVWLERGQIVHRSGNQFWTWVGGEGGLRPVLHRVPILSKALVIVYAVQADGRIDLSGREYTLPAGGWVQLLRKDTHPVADRLVFLSGDQEVEMRPREAAFRVMSPGTAEVAILPGDQWEKAVTLRFTLTGTGSAPASGGSSDSEPPK